MDRFPHLSDPSSFPSTDNIDVYKYPNNFDYSRYDAAQMRITLCSVPWDLGEAHVGQRTITGVGNVVDFGSTDARDAYFDGLSDSECYRFTTKYRAFHAGDEEIKVPVPVTALADYNYLEVLYYTEPTADEPLEYETNRISRWYYFIRDFEQKASNSTLCNLMLDTWQTYIYYVDIPYMYLQRGHYPLSKVDADAYLSDPIENGEWLQGDEASFGELRQEAHTESVVFNDGTMYACIVSSGSYTESAYGTVNAESGWRAYATPNRMVNGTPSPAVYAMAAGDLSDFLSNIESEAPQYKQTIQGVFFISDKLITLGNSYDFFGTTIYALATSQHTFTLIDLDKDMWGYPDEYADLAKLYTYPYTAIDVYTENGDVVRINVEDTTGDLSVIARIQLTFPWITIDSRLRGYGSSNRYQIQYHTANDYNFDFDGLWYETLHSWNVPIYGVIQDMQVYNSFATYWSREQNAYAAENARANANASAETALSNENAEADTTVANAAVQTTANSNINSNSNESAATDNGRIMAYNSAVGSLNNDYTMNTVRTENEAAENSASVAAASSTAGGLVNGAVSGAASGGIIGAAVGAVSGLISGAISGISTMAQNDIATDLAQDKAELACDATDAQVAESNQSSLYRLINQNEANTTNTGYTNSAITSTAANSAALTRANAQRTYSTEIANATRDYNTAISANNNQIREARLGAPQLFGQLANGDTGINRPQATFATIVKQPTGAIKQAGDMFLRYGYTCNRVVEFEGFNVMPKFTYWQCADLWLKSSTVPDAYMDQIRLLLFGGVTVWRDPADIGYVSIYENK